MSWSVRRSSVLGAVVAWACIMLAASAARADSLGPIPPDSVVASRCAPMTLSPNVVHVGRRLAGSAGPKHDACGPGGVAAITWGWGLFPGLSFVGQCRLTATHCEFKATAPTGTPGHRIAQGCINGNSGFGPWISCDWYAVIGKNKRGISGTVIDRNGQAVSRAVVSIRGPGGSRQETTDANGDYGAEVKPGRYTVSVGGGGAHATRCSPGSAGGESCSLNLARDDGRADFTVCSAADANDLATAAAGSSACPLKVFVKVVGPIPNVGTRSGLAVDNLFPSQGPVNFTTGSFPKVDNGITEPFTLGQQCRSGCANLLVTVVDPSTHKPPDPAAKVTARLDQIDTQDAPALHQQGSQFLCTQSEDVATRRCGTELTDLPTDSTGHVHLLYWAPGEMVKAHTTVKVEAEATCAPSSCSAGHRTGSGEAKVTVKPYVIYTSDGTLSKEMVRYLIGIARDRGLAVLGSASAHKFLEVALEVLHEQELIAARAVQIVSGPLGYGVILASEFGVAWTEYKEEQAIIAEFMEKIELRGTGLDDEPFERKIPIDLNGVFAQDILGGAASVLHFQAGGILWTLGKVLAEQLTHLKRDKVVPEHVGLSVYETSSCNERDPTCGPGYVFSPGIKPRLCFHFDFSNSLPGGDYEDTHCIFQYDPVGWIPAQGIKSKLP